MAGYGKGGGRGRKAYDYLVCVPFPPFQGGGSCQIRDQGGGIIREIGIGKIVGKGIEKIWEIENLNTFLVTRKQEYESSILISVSFPPPRPRYNNFQ